MSFSVTSPRPPPASVNFWTFAIILFSAALNVYRGARCRTKIFHRVGRRRIDSPQRSLQPGHHRRLTPTPSCIMFLQVSSRGQYASPDQDGGCSEHDVTNGRRRDESYQHYLPSSSSSHTRRADCEGHQPCLGHGIRASFS